jgi:CRP-like cAMP-binding protein
MSTSPKLSGYPFDTSSRRPTVKQTVRLDALRKVGLFKGLSRRSLVRIDQVSDVRTAHDGETLVEQGETGTEMMVVLSGTAVVRRGNRKVSELGIGESFGEMALLDRQTRSATVTAAGPVEFLVIDGRAFRKLLTKVPGLTDSLLATLSVRLREAHAAAEI